jgi:uncharacterized protein (DUF1800 family)
MSLESFIASNRFGFGLAPGDNPAGSDPRGWLERQLNEGMSAPVPTYGLPDASSLVHQSFAMIEQAKQDKGTDEGKQEHKEFRNLVLGGLGARFAANLTGLPLVERMTLFWSNHFTVSMRSKPVVGALALAMERDAVRPHVLGKFEDMLNAVATHPAMLLYLDNATSVGPNSKAGQRRAVGLNENYARELMELHTLGVRGGYTQTDVTTMAKILTGWTIDRPKQGGSGEFAFNERLHEPGAQTIMGRVYDQAGVAQGQAALYDLAHHPSTAKFIATKLVRHFVSDDPPEQDVDRIAWVFRQSGGDLQAVTRAVIGLDSVWQNPLPKVKTPYEMLLSAIKATGAPADKVPYDKLQGALKVMDNVPFTAASPAGWSDRADDWISPEALMNRVELCHMIAKRMAPQGQSPAAIAQALIGPVASADTLTAISRAPSPADGFALVLASPEFQRR